MTTQDPTTSDVFDPFGTLHSALWIGGGQWAGKSTVADHFSLYLPPSLGETAPTTVREGNTA
ncbi:MAG: hypothetical protein JWR24_4833 [Actinoallomurus sp.]|nr:hypothetical protein [Actinoallomurus sp.]